MIDFNPQQYPCRLGVISDTHGLLRPEAIALLNGVDLIIHAGDVGPIEVLKTLNRIAPVAVVKGNTDGGEFGMMLPDTETVRIGNFTIYVLHDVGRLRYEPACEGAGMIIHGHTHQPEVNKFQGVIFLNPGSIGPKRFRLPINLMLVGITDEEISIKSIDLDRLNENEPEETIWKRR